MEELLARRAELIEELERVNAAIQSASAPVGEGQVQEVAEGAYRQSGGGAEAGGYRDGDDDAGPQTTIDPFMTHLAQPEDRVGAQGSG